MAKLSASHPILSTPRLRLRQFRVEDTHAMHECFANPEAMRFWDCPAHRRLEETKRAVRNFIKCIPSLYQVWAVADAETDRCLGMVNYHGGHIRDKRVAIGHILSPAHQGQGLAIEAVSKILDFCFGELGLHRVQAFIDPDNTASRTLVEKLGFRSEGLLRDNLRVADAWRSDMLYALLETDYHANP
jgi:ribosomal-protein-alanine N-acetyltransferase